MNPPANTRIVALPGLPDGGDIVDYFENHDSMESEDLRRRIEALADEAEPITTETESQIAEPLRWRPFPVELFPKPLAEFVSATAAALGCDPAFVALPVLAVVGSAIGTSRVVAVKRSWQEPPVIWACVCARSGTLKSPALDAATKPLRDAQIDRLREHAAAAADYEKTRLWYDKRLSEWKRDRKSTEQPEKPEPPAAAVRYILSDCTVEALAPILATNPRGVLLSRDEWSGWIRGFNQYKSKGGSDAAAWLELWRAGMLIIDRKTGEFRTVCIPRAAVSICGTIQPGVLATTLTNEYFESGLAARILVAMPPERVKRWSDKVPSRAVIEGFGVLVTGALSLQHITGEHGPEPVAVPLSSDARKFWADWYNRHAKRIHSAEDDRQAAALAKLEAYAVRFALIFTLSDDLSATEVTAGAIRRGCELADWFAWESERVYGILSESDEDRERRTLAEWVRTKGGTVSVRDLTHSLRRFRGRATDARAALSDLVEAGYGRWVQSKAGPGRPTEWFELATTVTTTKTPDSGATAEGFGDGDTGDTKRGASVD